MQALLDHLVAIVVGSVMLLALAALLLSRGGDSRAGLGADVNRSALYDAVEVVEHDLRNAGAGGDLLAYNAANPAVGDRVTRFELWTMPDSAGQAPTTVRYDVVGLDSVEVVRDGEPVRVAAYALERLVHDGTAYVQTGGADRLSEFTLTPVDAAAAPAATLADARGLAVRIARLAQWDGDGVHRESRWESVFWPPNLSL